ncbi:hypothetical protein [Xanthomonas translucens]|uniref:hypothetical protein n=1 Tax=Xanthomonas campestris pv. translucens TaxID=343 RepID=UPI0010085877|nr:hypothetical protein [Xanthomonas translucens]MCS3361276.1 hypothetical protein [Xanthomonas translucens pv. translucens]MCT8279639.1 hypothetical protein [Xanthomonas translucens pv. translucens]MCT8290888.1 hypothetical protein [Xanthomonas translucens pv. translucens]MCT8294576.1 hypothetical protein [Xanthomonas translucens pv. translucens]MCT8314091.1 hypothetical protein [Xanthomonas translucens pv. translucens]
MAASAYKATGGNARLITPTPRSRRRTPNRASPAIRTEAAHRYRNEQLPITGRSVQGEIGQDGRLQQRVPGRQRRSDLAAYSDSGNPRAMV